VRGFDRGRLNSCFLLQDAQGSQVVFHLLKGRQYRLAIGSNRGVIAGLGLVVESAPPAYIKK
jgi:hypothetical protein